MVAEHHAAKAQSCGQMLGKDALKMRGKWMEMREPFRRARALSPVARRPSPVARRPSPVARRPFNITAAFSML
jgi:hypothetical protein